MTIIQCWRHRLAESFNRISKPLNYHLPIYCDLVHSFEVVRHPTDKPKYAKMWWKLRSSRVAIKAENMTGWPETLRPDCLNLVSISNFKLTWIHLKPENTQANCDFPGSIPKSRNHYLLTSNTRNTHIMSSNVGNSTQFEQEARCKLRSARVAQL